MPLEPPGARDVLQYSGRRCVVGGAGSPVGAALAGLLVDLGAEVHAIEADAEGSLVAGLASRTTADPVDPAAARAAAARVGAVVDAAFECTSAASTRASGPSVLIAALLPVMAANGAAVSFVMTASDGSLPDSGAPHPWDSGDFTAGTARLHTIVCTSPDHADSEIDVAAFAWLGLLLASPRAAALASTTITALA